MRFIDRADEMRRLDAALTEHGAFAVIWGRRRVGKTRLLIEWSRRHDGLYVAADTSAPAVQRRYLAAAVEHRFPRFAEVDYPDWRSLLQRLANEARGSGWPGPFVLDGLPYLAAADPTLAGVLQAWVDTTPGRPTLVVSGSSQRMMHGAFLSAGAPLFSVPGSRHNATGGATSRNTTWWRVPWMGGACSSPTRRRRRDRSRGRSDSARALPPSRAWRPGDRAGGFRPARDRRTESPLAAFP